ncbi:DUF6221 family protein [Streptomyces sp. NPDC006476]|uniref:DUF6221 family protein n=1 Tax=Streptomyces sp. NPDC006476 TaxID=3157175 RepID=UPI0033A154F3
MDDLVEWLRAQLDEDERIARAAGGTWWAPPDLAGQVHDSGGVNIEAKLRSFATHIAEHDPARVLREIDAKRRIIEEHKPAVPKARPNRERGCLACTTAQEWDATANEANCLTLRLLASPYKDRPGYREEWRP